MGWEMELFALLDDLEGQAAAAWEAEREVELHDRAQAEYAAVTLASRLAASVGAVVALELTGVGQVRGELVRVGDGWCLLRDGAVDWVLHTPHVLIVRGASPRAVPEVAWSPVQRLGLRSALRRLADEGAPCVVRLVDGSGHEVVLERVGSDFVEARSTAATPLLVPYGALVAVQSRDA